MSDPKTYCEYCKGITFDDRLGNCAACGAPRDQKNRPYFPPTQPHNLFIYDFTPGRFCTTDGSIDDNLIRRT